MDANFTLTQAIMEKARDYIPLAVKEAWVADNAPKCFDKLAITADDEAMPPMYMVNTGLKSRYLMGALVGLYLGLDFAAESADNPALMSVEEYDEWAGNHVMNQLERMKHDTTFKFKAYDLIADYKDLEKRLSTQLTALMTVQNDSVIRQSELMTNQMKELPALLEQLKALQEKNDDGK